MMELQLILDFTCCACGDPVSVTNGNVYFPILDLLIPSRGFPIALQRTYNSQQSTDSPFGIGWTHSYRRYLTQSGTTLIYHDESGGGWSTDELPPTSSLAAE